MPTLLWADLVHLLVLEASSCFGARVLPLGKPLLYGLSFVCVAIAANDRVVHNLERDRAFVLVWRFLVHRGSRLSNQLRERASERNASSAGKGLPAILPAPGRGDFASAARGTCLKKHVVQWDPNVSQSVSQLFHGPAPRSPLHRLSSGSAAPTRSNTTKVEAARACSRAALRLGRGRGSRTASLLRSIDTCP